MILDPVNQCGSCIRNNFLDYSVHTFTWQSKETNNTNPFENHSLNWSWLSNNIGMMKCSKAHNSAMLFWIGVPVRSNRFRQLKLRRVFHLILYKKKERGLAWEFSISSDLQGIHKSNIFMHGTIKHWEFNWLKRKVRTWRNFWLLGPHLAPYIATSPGGNTFHQWLIADS